MNETIRQFWQARTARERLILLVGGGALALMLLYAFVWQPMSTERSRLRAALPELRTKAAQMRADAQLIGRLKGTAAPDKQDIRAVIERSAEAAGIKDKLNSTDPLDERRARVTLNNVPFDDYLAWINRLQREYRVRVEANQVEALAEGGRVKVNATLARAGTT